MPRLKFYIPAEYTTALLKKISGTEKYAWTYIFNIILYRVKGLLQTAGYFKGNKRVLKKTFHLLQPRL
jgi:hypothetical protein